MKDRKSKTQFTDADVSAGFVSDYGSSETIVEYSEIDPTMPASDVSLERPGEDSYEDRPTEVDDDGITIVEDSFEVKKTGGKTRQLRPVVGWLACVQGPCMGMDYRLHANYNRIGRNASLAVNVEDPKFSKSPVAWVGYFQKTNAFFIGAESSTNVLYVNDTPLPAGQSREFFAMDRVRMGDTELLFVPLCGEKFTWNTPIEGES